MTGVVTPQAVPVFGTWTPSVGGSATYTTQVGTYCKIGRLVLIQGTLTINAIGTGSTSVISGLPFASVNGLTGVSVGYNEALAASPVSLNPSVNGSTIVMAGRTAGATGVTNPLAVFGNGARVEFTAQYLAAD